MTVHVLDESETQLQDLLIFSIVFLWSINEICLDLSTQMPSTAAKECNINTAQRIIDWLH